MARESLWAATGGATWSGRIAVVSHCRSDRPFTWYSTTWHGRCEVSWGVCVSRDLCLALSIWIIRMTRSQ